MNLGGGFPIRLENYKRIITLHYYSHPIKIYFQMTRIPLHRITFLVLSALLLSAILVGCTSKTDKHNSNFKGVQLGVITYSWRSMPGTPQDIINYCIQTGITSIELMGNVAEEYAGAPKQLGRPADFNELSQEEKETFKSDREESLR